MDRWRFGLFLTGQGINVLGNGLAPVALAFGILQVFRSATELGWVLGVREFAAITFGLIGGYLASRWSWRTSLGLGNIVPALGQAALALCVDSRLHVLPVFLIVAVLNGGFAALSAPAAFSLLRAVSQTVDPMKAGSRYRVVTTLGLLLGGAVGGVLVSSLGPAIALAIDAASFLAAAALQVAAALGLSQRRSAPELRLIPGLLEGYHIVRNASWAWRMILAAAISNAAVSAPLWVLGPLIAKETQGIGSLGWGIALTTIGVGSVVGGLLGGYVRSDHALRNGVFVSGLACLPLLALGISPQLITLIPAMFVAGAATELFSVAWLAAVQSGFDENLLARVWSWDQVASGSLQPLLQVTVQPLASLVGRGVVLIGCAAIVVGAVPYQLAERGVRER